MNAIAHVIQNIPVHSMWPPNVFICWYLYVIGTGWKQEVFKLIFLIYLNSKIQNMIVSFKISECAQNFCAPHICFLSVIVYLFNHYNSCIFHLCAISLRSLMIMALHNYLVAITNSCLFAISIKPCSTTNSPSSILPSIRPVSIKYCRPSFPTMCQYQLSCTFSFHFL